MKNEGLSYRGGQDEIVHLVADLRESVAWAETEARRWAFTLSNAGAYDFEDRADMDQLAEVNWDAMEANRWSGANVDPSIKRDKQAEFVVEHSFPWHLIKGIATKNDRVAKIAAQGVTGGGHQMTIKPMPTWYY
jgi:ssDNA thymidine ADP-ribosyltransferase, DarT